jgi:hypothetical protein
MSSGSAGSPETRTEATRFELPEGCIAPGRSQPKRVAPKRQQDQGQVVRRVALGVATFGVSLALVGVIYRFSVSHAFGDVAFENGTTAAIALLIGCFALPAERRRALGSRAHLLVCLVVLAVTPWTYQIGNQMEASGMDLATGFNFVFEVLLAGVLYRVAARA